MDLSKLSNEDLLALKSGDLSKVSNDGLMAMRASKPEPQKGAIETAKSQAKSLGNMYKDYVGNVVGGVASGFADIGDTLINAAVNSGEFIKNAATGSNEKSDIKKWNEQRNASLNDFNDERKDSTLFNVARIGGNIAATWPVGGVVGAGVRGTVPIISKVSPAAAEKAAPIINALANAISSGGMKTGLSPTTAVGQAGNMLLRAAGGGVAGAASAGMVNPEDAAIGAAFGAVSPAAISATGAAGRAAASAIRPFTQKGQERIAADVIRQFADGGPMNIDARQIVQGSSPTLAEATGNAGIATLQRGARDLRPNAFIERELKNAEARVSAFDNIAGNLQARKAAEEARDQAAEALYGRAFAADAMRQDVAKTAQKAAAPFAGVGLGSGRQDLATPGLRELTSRPMFKKAVDDAKKLAANMGDRIDDPLQSLQGLHYVKLALDDMLTPEAKSAMGRNASRSVQEMRDKLSTELGEVAPLYGAARQTYAEMSQPINAMEALQGLQLTDAKGNITLSKVQNAIRALEKQRNKPGISAAKSITDNQMQTLMAIRDDLLRQDNLGLGRSVGSNTFQNIATDNILRDIGGNSLTRIADRFGFSTLAGQVGQLAYNKPNEAIRNRLVDLLLDPEAAQAALNAPTKNAAVERAINSLLPLTYRAAPVISAQ